MGAARKPAGGEAGRRAGVLGTAEAKTRHAVRALNVRRQQAEGGAREAGAPHPPQPHQPLHRRTWGNIWRKAAAAPAVRFRGGGRRSRSGRRRRLPSSCRPAATGTGGEGSAHQAPLGHSSVHCRLALLTIEKHVLCCAPVGVGAAHGRQAEQAPPHLSLRAAGAGVGAGVALDAPRAPPLVPTRPAAGAGGQGQQVLPRRSLRSQGTAKDVKKGGCQTKRLIVCEAAGSARNTPDS
jgi:hypothetical protein